MSTEKIEIEQEYIDKAVRLATAYPNMLKQRKFQEELRAGKVMYTVDDAISDLSGGAIDYGSDHVQSSNISNIPERIVIKLSEGYVEKMNARLVREAMMSEAAFAELLEDIDTVNVALRHMEHLDRAIFQKLVFDGKSYAWIKNKSKGRIRYDVQIKRAKDRAIEVLAQEIMIREFYKGQ